MKVLIGIQARSGSTRLPNKSFALISGRPVLDRVLEACAIAAKKIERNGDACTVAVLTPEGDPIAQEFSKRVEIVEGPEYDVLERYALAAEKYDPDLIVRITGDCPLIPGAFIAYMTDIAESRGYDYFSNSDERFRTSIDGNDCEVFSRRMLEATVDNATTKYDREHVTPWMRREPPEWAKMGLALNYYDLSSIKLSVDTQEDLDRVRSAFESAFEKYQQAIKIYGRGGIHRL